MRSLILVLALLGAGTEAVDIASVEHFHGTGRACSGELVIRQKDISWVTSFSKCAAVSYELLEQDNDGDKARRTYRLLRTPQTCRYRILSLTHDKTKDPDAGWEITAYGQEKNYRHDKESGYQTDAPDMMSCYLLRESQKQAPPP